MHFRNRQPAATTTAQTATGTILRAVPVAPAAAAQSQPPVPWPSARSNHSSNPAILSTLRLKSQPRLSRSPRPRLSLLRGRPKPSTADELEYPIIGVWKDGQVFRRTDSGALVPVGIPNDGDSGQFEMLPEFRPVSPLTLSSGTFNHYDRTSDESAESPSSLSSSSLSRGRPDLDDSLHTDIENPSQVRQLRVTNPMTSDDEGSGPDQAESTEFSPVAAAETIDQHHGHDVDATMSVLSLSAPALISTPSMVSAATRSSVLAPPSKDESDRIVSGYSTYIAYARYSGQGGPSPTPTIRLSSAASTALTTRAPTPTAPISPIEQGSSINDAPVVIFAILRNAGSVSTLLELAVVNRAFFAVFDRHERLLTSAALYADRPAAWEFVATISADGDSEWPTSDAESIDTVHAAAVVDPGVLRHGEGVIDSLKALVLDRCRSFLRPETVAALGLPNSKTTRVDAAFWRVWTFCHRFGPRHGNAFDVAGQTKWLRGEPGDSPIFALGNIRSTPSGLVCGLGTDDLFDMMEVWTGLAVLLEDIDQAVTEGRTFGVLSFDHDGPAIDDDDTAEAILEEFRYHVLTLGLPAILSLASLAPDRLSVGFATARSQGLLPWVLPPEGMSYAMFLKQAVSDVFKAEVSRGLDVSPPKWTDEDGDGHVDERHRRAARIATVASRVSAESLARTIRDWQASVADTDGRPTASGRTSHYSVFSFLPTPSPSVKSFAVSSPRSQRSRYSVGRGATPGPAGMASSGVGMSLPNTGIAPPVSSVASSNRKSGPGSSNQSDPLRDWSFRRSGPSPPSGFLRADLARGVPDDGRVSPLPAPTGSAASRDRRQDWWKPE